MKTNKKDSLISYIIKNKQDIILYGGNQSYQVIDFDSLLKEIRDYYSPNYMKKYNIESILRDSIIKDSNVATIKLILIVKAINIILLLPEEDEEKECYFCKNHVQGDVIYDDHDNAYVFNIVPDIKYCPICGKLLDK